ncbi:MAG TPA: FtsW/RodA/SpoVE family cell cycle protein, partial [Xanthomonadales bacterium]|nr:FtsW/RodA/SpoVE family cell cycle protein [Xanthomonadales bacterium]
MHANHRHVTRANPNVTLSSSKGALRPRLRTPLKPPDPLLLGPIAFLVALGLVMVFSSSSAIAYSAYHDTAHYLKRQAVYLVVGLIVAYAAYRVDYH